MEKLSLNWKPANAKMYSIELSRLRMTAIFVLIISQRQHDLPYSGHL